MRKEKIEERKKIAVSALKDIAILYKGDVYDLAVFLLKTADAREEFTNSRSRYTVYGLSGVYADLAHLDRSKVLKVFELYNLPLGATVEHDSDVASNL